jgi:hypothetical protein
MKRFYQTNLNMQVKIKNNLGGVNVAGLDVKVASAKLGGVVGNFLGRIAVNCNRLNGFSDLYKILARNRYFFI